MKRVIAIVSILSLASLLGWARPQGAGPEVAARAVADQNAPTFQAIDLFIDPNNQPLAAYQLDFHATRGAIRIVGVEGGEGGEHAAFNKAPYYDPKAIQNDHILLAAYSLDNAPTLPTARTRIARIHLMIEGPEQPEYSLTLTAAGSPDARHIEAKAEFVPATNDKSNEPDKGR